MRKSARVVPLLDENFFVFAKTPASVPSSEKEMEALINVKLLAKAALWQGYTILEGFVPVRNRNHRRFATPKRNKLFLNFFLLSAFL